MKEKKDPENEEERGPRNFFRPVSEFFCRIGLGANDCKDQMALARLTDRYHAFCAVQRAAAKMLEMFSENDTIPDKGIEDFYEAVASGMGEVITHLKELGGEPYERLAVRLDELDRAVRNLIQQWPGESLEYRETITDIISTLHLPLRRSAAVDPSHCLSLHDIVRFSLDAARQTMFDLCVGIDVGDTLPRQLVAGGPMQYWVVDLIGGVEDGGKGGKKVPIEGIVSLPMKALWEGLTAFPWEGPPSVNTKGFLSVIFQCTLEPCIDPSVRRPFAKKNYIVVSKRYCNLTSRLGFHYATAEAFVGKNQRENYATFVFKGGAACLDRRERRVMLIAKLLDRFGFFTDVESDNLFAQIDSGEPGFILECLKAIGHIMTHTRQLDMAMCNDAIADWYYEEMTKQMSTFIKML